MKVGVAHVCATNGGGSEATLMWGLQALQQSGYKVELLTTTSPDLDLMNETYDTSVDTSAIRVRQAPRWLLLGPLNEGAAIRGARFSGFCQRIAPDYDLLISMYNLCDFGSPAIHFVADMAWDHEMYQQYDAARVYGARLLHRQIPLRKIYLWTARRLRRHSGRNLFAGEDFVVANSQWTAEVIGRKYGVRCQVVYPPVPASFPEIPCEEREQGFVCLGRVSHEKRIERIIEILRRVRSNGHDIHLHLLGPINNDPYGKYIKQIVGNHSWIIPEGQCIGERKRKLLSKHRFAIHGREAEPFGISVAEQVKAGCIPFVPNNGGQTEIINQESLCYENVEDAVAKINAVLTSEVRQARIRENLALQADRFSPDRFIQEFLDAVDRFAANNKARKQGVHR